MKTHSEKNDLSNAITADVFLARFLKKDENKRLYAESEVRFDLAERMKKMRKDKNITQQELAERVGCTQPFIAKLEQGAYDRCGLSTLGTYARAMGYDLCIDKLFTPKTGTFFTGHSSCTDLQDGLFLQETFGNNILNFHLAQWQKEPLSEVKMPIEPAIKEACPAA